MIAARNVLVVSAACAVGIGAAQAQVDDGGAYLQVHLGVATDTEAEGLFFDGRNIFAADANLDTGGAFGLIGGYRVSNGAGFEVELGSRAQQYPNGSDYAVAFLMLNGVYEFGQSERWRPYVVGGIGFAGNEAFDYEERGLAGQVKAGLRYKFGQTQSVGLEAAYLGANGLGEGDLALDYGAVSLSVAYRIGLGGRN